MKILNKVVISIIIISICFWNLDNVYAYKDVEPRNEISASSGEKYQNEEERAEAITQRPDDYKEAEEQEINDNSEEVTETKSKKNAAPVLIGIAIAAVAVIALLGFSKK